jgi:hypothetical protein
MAGDWPAGSYIQKKSCQIGGCLYGWRYFTVILFCKIRGFTRIHRRSDKTDRSLEAMIHLAAAVVHSQ